METVEIYQRASINLSEITELRKFGNKIGDIEDIEGVIKCTFEIILNKIDPQVISLFLFSKNGFIERFKITGKDKNNNGIDDRWLKDEKYLPGNGFSGRAAKSSTSSVSLYGDPHINNELSENHKLGYGEEYTSKLGLLKCGISVPLNGSKRTFGTIEIINKLDPITKEVGSSLVFSEHDFCWLTIVASHVSSSITRIKNHKKSDIYTKISRTLACYQTSENKGLYKSITNNLIGDLMPYKSCILRVLDGKNLFIVEQSHTADISQKLNSPRCLDNKESMVVNVVDKLKPKIVENINKDNINNFLSKDWIRENNLKSFVCLPLYTETEVVGTISLFTGYSHSFTRNDILFLENISYLLAAYQLNIKKIMNQDNQSTKENVSKIVEESFVRNDFDFRTVNGISKELNLQPSIIREVLERNSNLFRKSIVSLDDGRDLYCLSSKSISWKERLSEIRMLITKPIKKNYN